MKCPFRKATVNHIQLYGSQCAPGCHYSEEEFMDCIEEECTAYTIRGYSYMDNNVFCTRDEPYCTLLANFMLEKE